jgi:hypothetical protein
MGGSLPDFWNLVLIHRTMQCFKIEDLTIAHLIALRSGPSGNWSDHAGKCVQIIKLNKPLAGTCGDSPQTKADAAKLLPAPIKPTTQICRKVLAEGVSKRSIRRACTPLPDHRDHGRELPTSRRQGPNHQSRQISHRDCGRNENTKLTSDNRGAGFRLRNHETTLPTRLERHFCTLASILHVITVDRD